MTIGRVPYLSAARLIGPGATNWAIEYPGEQNADRPPRSMFAKGDRKERQNEGVREGLDSQDGTRCDERVTWAEEGACRTGIQRRCRS